MTLVYPIHMIPSSLTVPDEAVRGLTYKNGWTLFVSDPSTMAVSQFRIPRRIVQEAATDLEIKRLTYSDGTKFLGWLLKREYVECDRMDSDGRPSQFPAQKVAGPRPNMDIERQSAPAAKSVPVFPRPVKFIPPPKGPGMSF